MGMASSRTHKSQLLAVLLMAPFMAQADATIANVAAPSIHADLGTSGAELELVIGGYLIAFAVLLITGARLGQTHGYRRVFLLGVSVFTGASLLCGLAPGPIVLIVARVLQGAGAALMFPQTLTGIQLSFEGAKRARAIGLYAIALSSGAVAGQILGGLLVSADLLGGQWRSIFFVNVPVGAAVLAGGARYLPLEAERAARRVDVAGVATLSAAVLLVVLPLVLGRAEGWPTWTWLSLAASVPALAAFVVAERRVRAGGGAPLVNLTPWRRARSRAVCSPSRPRPARTTGCSSPLRCTSSRASVTARSSRGSRWFRGWPRSVPPARSCDGCPRASGRASRPPAACCWRAPTSR
jgi:MFS family permease